MQYLENDESPSLETLFSLKGKTALVIGGAGFLGKEISETLAELGANLIISSRGKEKIEAMAERLSRKFPEIAVKAIYVDITDEKSIDELAEQIYAQHPDGLDILVNSGW